MILMNQTILRRGPLLVWTDVVVSRPSASHARFDEGRPPLQLIHVAVERCRNALVLVSGRDHQGENAGSNRYGMARIYPRIIQFAYKI